MNSKVILPGQTIGIIGGGQLGRMMALSAKEMGYKIAVLDPTPNSPCGQVSDIEITAEYSNIEAIKQLAKVSDVITYEFENIDVNALEYLDEHSYLPQGSELLKLTRNRLTEKTAIQNLGIKVAPFRLVENEEQFSEAVTKIGLPAVLKTTTGGYDGKGQVVLRSEEDFVEALELVKKQQCILEGWVPFEKELSIIVARNSNGEVSTFPIAENVHINQILHTSSVPANTSKLVIETAESYAKKVASSFHLVGVLAIELFVTEDEQVYINELAPRPHNTGHYTMEAVETSQFKQHIRAVCNLPLGNTELLKPVVMVNILGEHVEEVLKVMQNDSTLNVHLYGKEESKNGRKMGHINIMAASTELAMQKVQELGIWEQNPVEVKI
ncbi:MULTISPECIES: 5-(carboxyamino)imidazole ribonucleotide synthase [Bacillaceae]|jgi:5-(carboxyamino)imidazole ribonucleotide synthase|uniref:N5-carboxyaminoimidazole ribonucleotide synthase n=1 Tax=Gottfriedia luciferensis TaxID=178774 RepID=A0ABX2ZWR9_9BACI|nr:MULTISPECIES: 5-(carboxyamino)imidazole ribonucleotide synthase [Bacillaceae]ODG92997.1 5-(carboxyamino)imidazole ribonucleotide synthase [Gottfriedia luciferensis]SFD69998.1 5-(carboxyamino)imidazole ribonucleotide synthase [Bacillus sp. UNCCL81]